MELEEFKDVLKLNKLANSWIEEYKNNNLGNSPAKDQLKKQYKEMKALVVKTDKLIEKQSGSAGGDAADWKSLYTEIETLAKSSPTYANCFGEISSDLHLDNAPISKETAMLSIKLKKLTSAWFGRFGDDVKDTRAISLVAAIYEQAKKAMAAPKTSGADTLTIEFYGSKSKRCRKMHKNIDFIAKEYEGLVDVQFHLLKDEDPNMHKLGIENLPTVIFKRANKKICKHEGLLSISATESKVNVLMEGATLTDSSSMKSIKDMKTVNKKELYSLGEFLLFYFEASWCGICKKTSPVIDQYAKSYSKVKFETIQVDGTNSLHQSFDVAEIPSLVFVRDGKVIGKHVGYINPSNLQKLLEKFAESNKHKIGLSHSGEASHIKGEEIKDEENRKGSV